MAIRQPRKRPPRALCLAEQEAVLEVLHSERFVDQAPATVMATLMDEGRYLCSVRTMYRVLRAVSGEALRLVAGDDAALKQSAALERLKVQFSEVVAFLTQLAQASFQLDDRGVLHGPVIAICAVQSRAILYAGALEPTQRRAGLRRGHGRR